MPENPEHLATVLKKFVENQSGQFLIDGDQSADSVVELESALAQADSQTLIDLVLALSSNFADSSSLDGFLRVSNVIEDIPEGDVSEKLRQYLHTASGFKKFYVRGGGLEQDTEDEEVVEGAFDRVVRTFESTLAQADTQTLIQLIISLSTHFADTSVPGSKERMTDTLRYFFDFNPVEFDEVA